MKKLLFLSVLLILAVGCQKNTNQLVEKIALLEKRLEVLEKRVNQGPQAPQAAEQTAAYDLPIGDSPVLGNPNAPVTITYFTDFQCPFCARAHESFVEKIFEDPQLKDKVKVVLKNFPLSFHQNAAPAAIASLAAAQQGNDCYWQYVKKLYSGQKELSADNYKKWAGEVKCKQGGQADKPLNADRLASDINKNKDKYDASIKKDMELAKTANVRGTPSFFVNGWELKQRSPAAVADMIKAKNLIAGF